MYVLVRVQPLGFTANAMRRGAQSVRELADAGRQRDWQLGLACPQ